MKANRKILADDGAQLSLAPAFNVLGVILIIVVGFSLIAGTFGILTGSVGTVVENMTQAGDVNETDLGDEGANQLMKSLGPIVAIVFVIAFVLLIIGFFRF